MAQIGTLRLNTAAGIVSVPIYPPADIGSGVYDIWRVNTPSGVGVVPLASTADAAYPYLRVKTQNHGTLAVHDSAQTTQSALAEASSYTIDSTPSSPTVNESTGDITNLVHDQSQTDSNGVDMSFSSGTFRDFDYDVTTSSWSGSASGQADRHFRVIRIRDSGAGEILSVGVHQSNEEWVIYDPTVADPNWDNYNNSGVYHNTGIFATSGTDRVRVYWNGSAWVADINNGAYTYTNSNRSDNTAVYEAQIGIRMVGGSQWGSRIWNYDMYDNTV